MANIMINDVCNLKCPYCFANEYVNGDTSTDITYKNFKKAVDWINRTGQRPDAPPERIALIGGEPTLHAQLKDLIEYAARVRVPGQEILIFTNAVKLDKYIDILAKHDVSLLINLNSPEDIGEIKYKQVVDNIRKCRLKGVRISIGINLYKPDLDLKFLYDVVEEFAFKDVRIGITAPNTPEKKERGPFAYFKEIAGPLVTLIRELSVRGSTGHLDCQKVPVCVMNDYREELDKIVEETGIVNDVIECSACTPVLDILTDLTVVRCFGVSDRKYGVPMEAFNDQMEVFDYFRTNIDNIGYFVVPDNSCMNCRDRALGRCQGGCLSFKMQDIEKIVKPQKELFTV